MGLCFVLFLEFGRRAIAEATLSHLAETDELTGLANRRRFDAALSAEWLGAMKKGKSLALLLADADAFKAYNDLFGHQAGDEVLRQIARCFSAFAPEPGSVACRWGGEEFALLIRGMDEAEVLRVAERLCHAVRALSLAHPRGINGIVTVSVGVAALTPTAGETARDLLASADAALYHAKTLGRNRSCGRTHVRLAMPPRRVGEV